MSDTPELTWPGSPEVEALVSRAVAERIDPLRAQLATVSRALTILAERVPPPQEESEVSRRIDALAAMIHESTPAAEALAELERAVNANRAEVAKLTSLERTLQDGLAELGAKVSGGAMAELAARSDLAKRVDGAVARIDSSVAPVLAALPDQLGDVPGAVARAIEAALGRDTEAREVEADALRSAIAGTVEQALARVEASRATDADNLVEAVARIEASRAADAESLVQALGRVQAARAADATRVVQVVSALEAPLQREAEERRAQAEELRQALADTVTHAVTHAVAEIDQAHSAEATALGEKVAAVAEAIEQAAARAEAARAADVARLADQVAALEGPLVHVAEGRQSEIEELRTTVATTIDQAASRIEAARSDEAVRLLEQVAGLVERAEADARRRDEQAGALLAAVDERLQALHHAGVEAGTTREDRLAARLEAVAAQQASGLLTRIDERITAITDLESIPPLVASEVQSATAAALTGQVQPLMAGLVEAIDTLAHEGGRIEAMAKGHAGEARAIEDRVATLFVELVERAESAADHSRARISEGQVALGTRLDAIMSELLTSISSLAERLEVRAAEDRQTEVEELRTAIGASLDHALARIEAARAADAAHVVEVVSALEAPLQREAEDRRAQTEELRQALAVAVAHAVAKIDQARGAEATTLSEQVAAVAEALAGEAEGRSAQAEALRRAVAEAVEQAETARAADVARLADQVAALEGPLVRVAEGRQTEVDELRTAIGASLDQALARIEAARATEGGAFERTLEQIEAARAADAGRLLEQIATLAEALSHHTEGREAEADRLRATVAAALDRAITDIEAARAADATRVVEAVSALEVPLQREAEERRAQTEELRQVLAVAVAHAVAKIDQARSAEATSLGEQVAAVAEALAAEAEGRSAQAEALRRAVAEAIEEADTRTEAARTAEVARLADQVAALEGPLVRVAEGRRTEVDELRTAIGASLDQALGRIEEARSGEAVRLLEQVAGLVERAEADARRRDEQAGALLAAVDERLQALHHAGVEAGATREERLAARLEAVAAEQGSGLLARIDERTAAITELESIPPLVASEVQSATAAALTGQVQPLVARLVEAIDTLTHEGGRIEAMARAHAGEARAIEDRVTTLFVEVAERAESAVDHSRARISEGQVALGTRFDAIMSELLTSISAVAERLEVRVAESAEGLRSVSGHQNGALLDAVNRSSQQVAEGLTEVRSALYATGTEWASRGGEAEQRAEALAERLDALRVAVESVRQDPRLEALVVEQVAAREAQLTAIEAVASRIDEVGPVVARALLAEVERATRAANAAEEAVASLRPEALRSALGDAADEIRSAASRLDGTIGTLADQVGQGLAALTDSQAGIREKLGELQQPSEDATVARLEALDGSLAGALESLGEAITRSRDELLTLTTRAIERSAALADEVASTSGTALEDLRASQTVLREAVEDGAHKAELAALDIRGLRERLTPHLVALADATTRRADADQAGFDAVLARLDQLLAARQR